MPLAPASKTYPKRDDRKGTAWPRWLPLLVLVVLFVPVVALSLAHGRGQASDGSELDYSRFYALVVDGEVDRVTLDGQTARGTFKAPVTVDGKARKDFTTTLPPRTRTSSARSATTTSRSPSYRRTATRGVPCS